MRERSQADASALSADARRLAALSYTASDQTTALLLAAASYRLQDSADARGALLAAEQRACSERSRRYIENAISTAYGPRGDIAGVAQLVIILIHGISIQVLFEQEHWSHERVRALLAGQIETFLRRGPIVAPRAVP